MAKVCDMDCINCKFDDCIKEDVYSEKSRYCNRPESQKQYQRDYAKRKRQEAKAKGLCIICKKVPATHGTKCRECYYRQKRFDRAKYSGERTFWLANGKCYFCGRNPVEGKKVCAQHYEIYKARAEYMLSLPQTKQSQRRFVEWHWKLRGNKKERGNKEKC